MTLGNALSVNGQLNLSGSNPLTLTGNISGTGGLNKNGASTLTLSAATTTPADQPQQRHAGGGQQHCTRRQPAQRRGQYRAGFQHGRGPDNQVNLAGNLGIGGSADSRSTAWSPAAAASPRMAPAC
ncbi:hypothetical protein CSV86_029550 [Pseudomonas putida CSV86]|uniref:Uncharacterized protein n=1 Tax=Pseudomonas bharatica CSV86 TaxID=1005395 RepID=A0A7K4ENQ0_9PSED|nr:hypothetical protein [Pseudomonas bharatica]NNJ18959.1 hypothetical protein [Pseudomonas bharatica CSV86]